MLPSLSHPESLPSSSSSSASEHASHRSRSSTPHAPRATSAASASARAAVPLMRDPEQAQTQNIANCLWSYAKSGDGTPAVRKELFSELADAASKRVDEFNAQELGNTVRC